MFVQSDFNIACVIFCSWRCDRTNDCFSGNDPVDFSDEMNCGMFHEILT